MKLCSHNRSRQCSRINEKVNLCFCFILFQYWLGQSEEEEKEKNEPHRNVRPGKDRSFCHKVQWSKGDKSDLTYNPFLIWSSHSALPGERTCPG